MNKKIASVLVGIFVMGLVSAGLVSYLSNMVSGSVVVDGPVFYLSKTITPINEVEHYSLNLNEFDDEYGVTSFTGTNNQWFVTEELGVDSFYPAKYKFYIKACAENNTETYLTGQIKLTLEILHSDGTEGNEICYIHINDVPTTNSCGVDDYNEHIVECTGNELDLDATDRFVLITSDGSLPIKYSIKMDENSKIEVTPITT